MLWTPFCRREGILIVLTTSCKKRASTAWPRSIIKHPTVPRRWPGRSCGTLQGRPGSWTLPARQCSGSRWAARRCHRAGQAEQNAPSPGSACLQRKKAGLQQAAPRQANKALPTAVSDNRLCVSGGQTAGMLAVLHYVMLVVPRLEMWCIKLYRNTLQPPYCLMTVLSMHQIDACWCAV